MTESEFRLFLSASMMLCVVLAIFNIFKAGRRGMSAYVLSVAFLACAVTLYLAREHASTAMISTSGGIVAALLVTDLIIRSRDQEAERRRKQ